MKIPLSLLCKRFLRSNCDYTWNGLRDILPVTLDRVPLSSIRKFARKCWRYMDAYRSKDGHYLTPRQIEYAVRRYRGHRTIPQSVLKDLEYNSKKVRAQPSEHPTIQLRQL